MHVVCVHTCAYACVCVCVCERERERESVCCSHMCVCVCVCTDACMCGWHGGGKGNQLHEMVYMIQILHVTGKVSCIYIYICKFIHVLLYICMRVYIGAGRMKVWLKTKLWMLLGGGGGYMYESLEVAGMKVCLIDKLWESKIEFLYNIFWVLSFEYRTFRVYGCVSKIVCICGPVCMRYGIDTQGS